MDTTSVDYKEKFKSEREFRHLYSCTMREWLVDEDRLCASCNGCGYVNYGSTATWRRGAGGQAFTLDVCESCWGSGDKYNRWPHHGG